MTGSSQQELDEVIKETLTEDCYDFCDFDAADGRTERQRDECRTEEDVDIPKSKATLIKIRHHQKKTNKTETNSPGSQSS
jgi:hypothetical protein